ncbi:MAG: ABC transporter permease [Gemmatimonadota bacterium]|nr:ABC transporter permease [Gemmatimonadota bacterium]
MFGRIGGDLRFAFRQLARRPGFATVAILTLGLGIGANTAIFSVVDAVLLRSLPFEHEDRLVSPASMPLSLEGFPEGPADAFEFADELPAFERLAAWTRSNGVNLMLGTEPVRAEASEVTLGFFPTVGVRMQEGRSFSAADDTHVAVLGHRLWRDRFGGGDVVGSTVSVNGRPVTIVGVAGSDFELPEGTDLWLPLSTGPDRVVEGTRSATTVGLLREDATIEQARAELALFAERHLEGSWMQDGVSRVRTLRQVMVGDSRTPLMILLAATALILLIACSNVANLFLTRAVGRGHELTVRASLGAGRGRLVQQLTTEALVIAVAGGLLGLVLAFWTLDVIVAAAPADFPRFAAMGIDVRILGFAAALSVVTGLLFGIWPALRGARVDLAAGMKTGRLGSGSGAVRNGPLVVGQVALTLVLLVGGGLLLQSLMRMRSVDPGFTPEGAITASVSLPRADYPDEPMRDGFMAQLLERIRATPGVEAAGGVNFLPLSTALGFSAALQIDGRPDPDRPDDFVGFFAATPGYFDAVGQPIVEGRSFDSRDVAEAAPVAVISRSLARRQWGDESPLGARVRFSEDEEWYTIVGVAGDVRTWGLADAAPLQIYLSSNHTGVLPGRLVVRGARAASIAAVRGAVAGLDASLPVHSVSPLSDVVRARMAEQRFLAQLLTTFALMALTLAGAGIYGVLSYRVASRRHEMGVRLTFGARSTDVLGLVLREGVRLVALGVAIGILGALASGRLLAGVLFDVAPTHPATLLAASVFLVGVSIAACLAPATRASRVDPAVVLRED